MIPIILENNEKKFIQENFISSIQTIDDKDIITFSNGKKIICKIMIDASELRRKLAVAKVKARPRKQCKRWDF